MFTSQYKRKVKMREDPRRRFRNGRSLLSMTTQEMTVKQLEEVIEKFNRNAIVYQKAVESFYQKAEEAESELWKRRFKVIKN